MPHIRQQIRAFTIAALETSSELAALTPTPSVEGSRSVPTDLTVLPRVLVYLRGESAEGERLTESPREYLVKADLVVEYVSRLPLSDGAFEDDLDDAAVALEAVMDRLETTRMGKLVRQVRYIASEPVGGIEGRQQTFSLRMRYSIEYGRVVAPVLAVDFVTNVIEYLAGDVSPDDNPTDSITLPT